jgi:hypothetical protein
MAINQVWFNEFWGWNDGDDTVTGSATVNLPSQSDACATVALTRVANYDEFSFAQVYFIGYTTSGNTVPVSDTPAFLVAPAADSFTVQADITSGAFTSQITIFLY